MPIFGAFRGKSLIQLGMIDTVKAFLDGISVIVMQIFHQPADFSWYKQMEVMLVYLEHTFSIFAEHTKRKAVRAFSV